MHTVPIILLLTEQLQVTYRRKQDKQWPLCVIMSDEQISPPSLVSEQNSSHLHS